MQRMSLKKRSVLSFSIPGLDSHNFYLIPLFAGWGSILGPTLSYFLSASMGHSVWLVPYISDVINCTPESSINCVICQLSSYAVLLTSYIQHDLHRQSYSLCSVNVRQLFKLLNRISLFFGVVGSVCFSVGMVTSQKLSPAVHSGVSSTAIQFILYYWLMQVLMDACLCSRSTSIRHLQRVRRSIMFACVAFGLGFMVFNQQFSEEFIDDLYLMIQTCDNNVMGAYTWRRDYSRYRWCVAALSEWLLFFLGSFQFVVLSRQWRVANVFPAQKDDKCGDIKNAADNGMERCRICVKLDPTFKYTT